MATRDQKLPILRGSLDALVLQAVSDKPRHGFDISLWLETGADGALLIDDSALYQALHRLETKGFIRGRWKVSDNNRRARYYSLTPAGRTHLAGERRKLISYAQVITGLLGSPPAGDHGAD